MDRYESAYEKFNDLDKKREKVDLDDFEEFMRKVEEVNKMVHALASGDKAQVEEATKSADSWLANQKAEKSDRIDLVEETIHDPTRDNKRRPVNKSVINRNESGDCKPQEDLEHLNCETMSQEAFMKSVEEDAKKRSEDRKRRIFESDEIKVKAGKAFREKDFEKALDLYNKAIEVRKDSCALYTNRALTLLNLELYTRAVKDCEVALRLNETSLKARLYKWHGYYEMGEDEKAKETMDELKSTCSAHIQEIEEYEKKVMSRHEDADDDT